MITGARLIAGASVVAGSLLCWTPQAAHLPIALFWLFFVATVAVVGMLNTVRRRTTPVQSAAGAAPRDLVKGQKHTAIDD